MDIRQDYNDVVVLGYKIIGQVRFSYLIDNGQRSVFTHTAQLPAQKIIK